MISMLIIEYSDEERNLFIGMKIGERRKEERMERETESIVFLRRKRNCVFRLDSKMCKMWLKIDEGGCIFVVEIWKED